MYACQNAVELRGGIPAQRFGGGPHDRYRLAQNRNPSVVSPKPGDLETEKHMTEQKNGLESQGLWRSSVVAEERERECVCERSLLTIK